MIAMIIGGIAAALSYRAIPTSEKVNRLEKDNAELISRIANLDKARKRALGDANALTNAEYEAICFQEDDFTGHSNSSAIPMGKVGAFKFAGGEVAPGLGIPKVSDGQSSGGPGEANSVIIKRRLGSRTSSANDGE